MAGPKIPKWLQKWLEYRAEYYVRIQDGPERVRYEPLYPYSDAGFIKELLADVQPSPVRWLGDRLVLLGRRLSEFGTRLSGSASWREIGGIRVGILMAILQIMFK